VCALLAVPEINDAQTSTFASRLALVQTGLQRSLDKFRKAMAQPDPTPTERDLSNAALFILITGGDPKEAQDYLTRAFAVQNMDTASPQYGEVPWQIGHPEIVDGNADEFTNQAIGSILLGYQNRLDANFLTNLHPHLVAALSVLERRNVPVSYTNIYLMQTVDLLLIGQAVNDSTALSEGAAHLDTWLAYTAQNGIHEFDSPTYYAADLDSLIPGFIYTSDAGIKAKLKRALDYFWTDLAANYFPGRQSLSGPHSRDYDFLNGTGGIELYYFVEGILPDLKFGALDFEKTYLLEQNDPAAYHPDSAIVALAGLPQRWVTARYGNTLDYSNFITPDFTLGGATGSYDSQDKLIAGELAGLSPVMSIVPDQFDAPWGKVESKDSSGHEKPTHLPIDPVTVQNQGVLLSLIDLNLSSKTANSDLGTNLILPAHADEINVDGQRIDLSQPFKQPVESTPTVGVMMGHGAIAFRFFHWDDCTDGQTVLQSDSVGLKLGALRLTHYHGCQSVTGKAAPHLRVGVLIVARHVDNADAFHQLIADVQKASITDQGNTSDWAVTAAVNGTTLEIRRNPKGTLTRTIDGKAVTIPVFAVNNQSYSIQ
jgi:hypothetical protein